MKFGLAVLLTAALIGGANAEEVRTLAVETVTTGQMPYSEPVVISAGEWVELLSSNYQGFLEFTVGELTVRQATGNDFIANGQGVVPATLNPIKVAGPSTIRLQGAYSSATKAYVTLAIHRVSSPTTPAAIPAEPGQNFAVVMESSSDLIYWTPAAPGSYAGTEPKRFFRVRIDRE